MDRADYEREKRLLQIELLKLPYWAKRHGHRLVVVFEGLAVDQRVGPVQEEVAAGLRGQRETAL